MPFPMAAVLKNIEIRGSTMGSRSEFRSMIDYILTKQIRPVISRVVFGIDDVDQMDSLFEDMKCGRQFGKLVIEVAPKGYDQSDTGEMSRL